ncbi:PhoD-like phosphatase N-terminal domain-containing protein [Nocardia acidivorans]|uniref:PhoD-like phosphatase N-terminal domain-containing protein n=1 Tax=Nocardia acidivorans TaxID=404580 RepID=UPI000AB40F2E
MPPSRCHCSGPGIARAESDAFRHGVASGDPLPGGVIIWTRVTPSADATPGSGIGAPTPVRWEVADDESFGTLAASGTQTATAESALLGINRHLHYAELDSHGYGVLHVDAEQAQMDWFYLDDVADPNTGVRHGGSFGVRRGGRIEPRPTPMV